MIWHLPLVVAAALHAPVQPPDVANLVKASLLAHDTKVKPGDTVQLAVVLDVAKGWHIYWPGQNDSGMATSVDLTFPKDSALTAGPVSFPVPHRHLEPGEIINYTHEGKVILTVPVKVPASAPIGSTFKVTAAVAYLVCKDSCMPGEATVSTTITTAEKTEPGPAAKTIDDARAAQPKDQAAGFDSAVDVKWEGIRGETLVITAKDAAVTKVTFFPASDSAKLEEPIKSGQAKGRTLRLTFDRTHKPAEGVIELVAGNTTKAWSFRLPRPQASTGLPVSPQTPKAPADKPVH